VNRLQLREAAKALTREFNAVPLDRVSFRVRALTHRRLELVVWPEGGVDTYMESARDPVEVESASDEFRRVVARYAAGERPPFFDDPSA
jgi:hypothetical protein